ncbi:Ada metal-binding domain-containing protein [Emticicia sp. 17c]|uniref:Ada metal-binding domain-containing protein n=1 Tax=Emticicia sp. 17c TaxID=3127704 RepID=UPI00301DE52C
MIQHKHLGDSSFARAKNLFLKIQSKEIMLAGNRKLKIYGCLDCKSGKRMRVENRVFFRNRTEAIEMGFRPCAVCMREEYRLWKCRILR